MARAPKPGFTMGMTMLLKVSSSPLPSILAASRSKLTISLGVATLQQEFSTNYGVIMAGAAMAAVPIVAVFLMFQNYFTQGITMGAVKG